MKRLTERLLIKILKSLRIDLLTHAHVQIGAGHNTYSSGEEYVINTLLNKIQQKNPSVIFDVGANIGDYAKMLRVKFPDAQIHCFEPGPEAFERLTANTAELNIKLHNLAVGSESGTLTLVKSSNDDDGAMLTVYKEAISNVFTFAGDPNESIVCNMVCLDDFCNSNNVQVIDFLKIDVEGHELEVLKGAARMISENKIGIIQFEFNEFNIFSKTFFYDYYKILRQYKFYRIMPRNKLYPLGEYTSSHEIFRYQNILAINNSLNYTHGA
jgi:FkbM family methyltransferase